MQRSTSRIVQLMLLFIIVICICYLFTSAMSSLSENLRLSDVRGWMKSIGAQIVAYSEKNGSCPEGGSMREVLETIGWELSKEHRLQLYVDDIHYHPPETGNWFFLSWRSQPKRYMSSGKNLFRSYHWELGYGVDSGYHVRRIWDDMNHKTETQWLMPTAAPADNSEVSLMKADWRKAIQDCLRRGTLESGYGDYESVGFPEPVHFSWKNGKPPYSLLIKSDGMEEMLLTTESDSIDVYNLMVGRTYKWQLKDADCVTFSGTFTTARTPRLINLADRGCAPVNVRDVGGYATIDGKNVRQGLVFRGSDVGANPAPGIAAMSDANRDTILKELRIKTELDLRYKEQVGAQKASGISPEIRWLHYPINAYNPFDGAMNELFRDTMRCFADESNYPIYIHCSGGVDRTGEICFLLGALLGMEEEDLFTDYELSTLSRFPRPRDIPYFQEWLKRVAAFSPQDGGGLSHQAKVENYLLGIGVSKQEIETIRSIMLQ